MKMHLMAVVMLVAAVAPAMLASVPALADHTTCASDHSVCVCADVVGDSCSGTGQGTSCVAAAGADDRSMHGLVCSENVGQNTLRGGLLP